MNQTIRKSALVLMIAVIAGGMATISGCAKATKETKTNAYKQARDKLQALATKDAKLKAGIDAKLAEFDKEFKAAEAKEGEEGVKAIGAIVARMNKYHDSLSPAGAAKGDKTAKPATANPTTANPTTAKPGTPPAANKAAIEAKAAADKAAAEAKAAADKAKAAADKAKAAADKVPTGHPADAPGGKLGGTAPPTKAPPAPAKPTGGSGFGGK